MGVAATYLAANLDGSLNDGGVRAGLFRGRAGAKLDESPPRHWPDNLCPGLGTSSRRVVGTFEGEGEEEIVPPFEVNGTHQARSDELYKSEVELLTAFSSINGLDGS